MPERLFSAGRAAVQILAEETYDGGRNDRERFATRIIERLLTQFEDPASKMTQDDIDYLMNKLRQLAACQLRQGNAATAPANSRRRFIFRALVQQHPCWIVTAGGLTRTIPGSVRANRKSCGEGQ